ncbi:MAG: hypothetical protein IJY99_03700 [Alphaproteobacteria bacterium]|nr:hypothetical protein [Alphaproteobacteria bacterium]
MTPEQLKWTDEQWAAHLGCAAQDVPKYKRWVAENYLPYIALDAETKRYLFVLSRRNDTPSGFVRYIDMMHKSTHQENIKDARDYANEIIIPGLWLNSTFARVYDVPQKILQMLHINKKQR